MEPKHLDKIIHERVRLAIISALAARGTLAFTELKELLDLTDGNLSVKAGQLEDAGVISVQKAFVGKKPRTTYTLTADGRDQFGNYLKNLEKMIHQGNGKAQGE